LKWVGIFPFLLCKKGLYTCCRRHLDPSESARSGETSQRNSLPVNTNIRSSCLGWQPQLPNDYGRWLFVQVQAVVEVLKRHCRTGIKKSGETLVISWVGEEIQVHACDFAPRRQAIGLNFSPIRQTATFSYITVVH
jgi:hypothetical protein